MLPQEPRHAPHARVTFLDGLRFIAAGGVLFQHIAELHSATGFDLVAVLSPGVFGVALFFLLSGYVIPLSVRRGFDLTSFVVGRIFRIYPLVLVTFALVACFALAGWPGFEDARTASARDWIANLLLVQDYVGAKPLHGVTWTLSLEFAWYALFATSLFLFASNPAEALLKIVPVALVALAALSLLIERRIPLARPGMVYAALLGSCVYLYHQGRTDLRRTLIHAAVFTAVMLFCNIVSFGYFTHPHITLFQAALPWLAATAVFLVVTLVPAVRESVMLNSRAVTWLGAVSFSTYMLHPFAVSIAQQAPHGAFIVLSLALTVLLSALGSYGVERPGQQLGRWLNARRAAASRAAAPLTSD
jgi:peptidoglycan/LPS O-acetylase OafA/YrhL